MKKSFKKRNIPINWIFSLLFIVYSNVTFGQWLDNGNKLYYNSGEVGIGTNQPTHKLQVNDGYFAVYNGGITVKNPLNELAGFNMNWNNNIARFRIGGEGVGSVNGIDFQGPNDVSYLRLLNNGKVGIGTQNPAYGRLQITQSSDASNQGLSVLNSFGVRTLRLWADSNNSYVYSGGTGQANLVLNNTGNIGVGTSNPEAKLDIVGNVKILDNTQGENYTLEIETTKPKGGISQKMLVYDPGYAVGLNQNIYHGDTGAVSGIDTDVHTDTSGSASGARISMYGEGTGSRIGADIIMGNHVTGNHTIFGMSITCAGASSDRPVYGLHTYGEDVNSFDGKVGIGVLEPTYKLEVNGSVSASDGFWNGSDKRWKKNIKKIEAPLNKIKQLNGKTYDWRKDEFPENEFGRDCQIGFLAQDVQEVFPELVKENNEGYLSINYSGIIPVLVEALKEQQVVIEAMQEEMEELKSGTNSPASNTTDYSSSTSNDTSISAELFQNIPNPFSGETDISFSCPKRWVLRKLYFTICREPKFVQFLSQKEEREI